MSIRAFALMGLTCAATSVAASDVVDPALIERLKAADVVILGEVHDNPHHHRIQADIVAQVEPTAMVWEMLTQEVAQRMASVQSRDQAALEAALNWAQSGWPSFDMYFPIFQAAGDVPVYGGQVPRQLALAAIAGGPEVALGGAEQAAALGVEQPLPESEMEDRLAAQMAAHCDALDASMLPMMVSIQRVRDAKLAQGAMFAIVDRLGPVVVITGNGHARTDWGVPVYLDRAAPELDVVSIGQSEDGLISGVFDVVIDSPSIERPDPCLAFQSDG